MLTEKAIIAAKPKEKLYRISDGKGEGLHLEIAPNGSKRWRLRFRLGGKEKMISLGVYPAVSLKEAREKAQTARKNLQQGINPSENTGKIKVSETLFRVVAREWWEKFLAPNGGRYPSDAWRRIERETFPFIGDMDLTEITTPIILGVLKRIEARGNVETTHKVKSYINQIMRFGVACGHIASNPAADLIGALAPRRKQPRAAIIDPKEAGALMRAIKGYEGSVIVRCALQLAALTFVRPGELRTAEWSEVDLESAEWRIPAAKMKMKRPHIVPLARQAVTVLNELNFLTGHGSFLFPSARGGGRPMSDMAVNAALRRMGYTADKMVGHGFRAMASSLLAEQEWSTDAIECQLAHAEKNKVRAAYHRSDHLAERKRMMQAWADYLDSLANSVNGI